MFEILPIITLTLVVALAIIIIMLSIKVAVLNRNAESRNERITNHHRYFIDLCQALDDRLTRHADQLDQHQRRICSIVKLADQEHAYVRALGRDVGGLRADAEFTRIEAVMTPGPVVLDTGIDGTSPYTIQYWLEELAQLEAEAVLHGINLKIEAKLDR